MTPEHMSGDETDDSGKPETFKRIDTQWRGTKMRTFLHGLDTTILENRRHPIGTRKAIGRAPRVRLASGGKSENGPAPKGLPINCYNEAWLNKLKPFQRFKLEVQEKEFDFSAVIEDVNAMQS